MASVHRSTTVGMSPKVSSKCNISDKYLNRSNTKLVSFHRAVAHTFYYARKHIDAL